MAILSREQFDEKRKRRVELVKLASGDEVYLAKLTNFRQSQLAFAMYNEDGKLREDKAPYLRAQAIVDQVCTDEDGTAMYQADDLEDIANSDDEFIREVYQAIKEFNDSTQKKRADTLSDAGENSEETTDSGLSASSSKNGATLSTMGLS